MGFSEEHCLSALSAVETMEGLQEVKLLVLHQPLTLTCLSSTGVLGPEYKGKARQLARQNTCF